jgi:hypothetical protein
VVDVVTLIYYAAICGALGYAAPSVGAPLLRVALGVVVGIVAAALLPMLRGSFGF